jgi:hypothetical protein
LGLTALTVLFLVTRAHFWAWRPKTRMTSWQPAHLIRPATTPSPADVGYYNWSPWKAKTQGYKFSEGRRTQFCLKDSQNFSSTNIRLLLSWHRTVTVRPLFRFLTISRVIELCFKRDWSHFQAKTRGYKFFEEWEPSSAPKIVKIVLQQTLDCYCLDIEMLLSDPSSDF